jgi:hypothetical protein
MTRLRVASLPRDQVAILVANDSDWGASPDGGGGKEADEVEVAMGWLLKDWMGFASELSEVFRVDGALPEVVASITPCRPLKPPEFRDPGFSVPTIGERYVNHMLRGRRGFVDEVHAAHDVRAAQVWPH